MTSINRALAPLAVVVVMALLPAPAGLPHHAWFFVAIFGGVVIALILEPLPPAAVGLIGITVVALLARWALFSPGQLAMPGFDPPTRSIECALSGFSNSTVWLSFAAFMFAAAYQKTRLCRRIALMLVQALGGKTLTLGYAVMLADTLLAPFTPSNTHEVREPSIRSSATCPRSMTPTRSRCPLVASAATSCGPRWRPRRSPARCS